MKLIIRGDEAVIEERGEDAASKFAGVKGKIKLNTPFSKRELTIVDRFEEAKPAKKKAKKTKQEKGNDKKA
jgi:hypothetical protein